MIRCFALKISFSHKKLCSRFYYFKFFISADCCEVWKFTDLRKLETFIQPKSFEFLSSFCTYLIVEKKTEFILAELNY